MEPSRDCSGQKGPWSQRSHFETETDTESKPNLSFSNSDRSHSSTCKATKNMDSTYLPSLLTILLLLSVCFAATSSSKAATTQIRRPGFLYTRIRGRCTPQFWSSRREAWPRMIPQTSMLSKVFGSRVYERFRSDLTLLESTTRNDDENAFGRLVRQGTAALLNSYAREGFPFQPWQVKTLFIQALVSKEAGSRQANMFLIANQTCNQKGRDPQLMKLVLTFWLKTKTIIQK